MSRSTLEEVMGKVNRVPTKVWRISENAPMGEWVDLAESRQRPAIPRPEPDPGTWVRSSYDLLDGVEVRDDGEPVPDDVFDELFHAGNNLVGKPAR